MSHSIGLTRCVPECPWATSPGFVRRSVEHLEGKSKDVDSEELVCERVWRESYAIVQPQTQEVSVGSLNEFIPPRWRSRGGLVTCAA